jgi:hypothetical protein
MGLLNAAATCGTSLSKKWPRWGKIANAIVCTPWSCLGSGSVAPRNNESLKKGPSQA